ncbi:MAG: T9SS type A sorting domain-containing protein [Bacteroidota bacterium]
MNFDRTLMVFYYAQNLMCRLFLISFFGFIFPCYGHCQDSIHFYGDTASIIGVYDMIEPYDRGYIIAGAKSKDANYFGWLQKTSINGEALWSKSYGSLGMQHGFVDILKADDGGIVCAGSTSKVSPGCGDPMLLKLNACGEKEWCRIYSSSNCNASADGVADIPGGGFMMLVGDWIGAPDVWLFRLNETGGVIWKKEFVSDPWVFSSPWAFSVFRTSDSCYMVTGEAYSPDSLYPGNYLRKIFHLKVDINGNLIYEYPWGNNNGIISFGRFSIEDTHHCLYTAGDSPGSSGDAPCIFKTTEAGLPDFYHDLKGNVFSSTGSSINWFADSTIVVEAFWRTYTWGTDTLALIKIDKNGNTLQEKPIFTANNKLNTYPGRSCITYNDRVVLSGSISPGGPSCKAYLVKLRNDLTYDSVYNQPHTYDSLCPHPITSDTVSLSDCSTVTSIYDPSKEPEKSALHIYPNPAADHVTIELPLYLVRKTKTTSYTTTTIYQQWGSAMLEIYDLFGKLVLRQQINQKTGTISPEISNWHTGMYMARLLFMNEMVSEAKFVKQSKN